MTAKPKDTSLQTEINFSARANKKRASLKRGLKSVKALREIFNSFYGKNPSPTLLEQALFITSERYKWIGSTDDFVNTIIKISGHSNSVIYRLFFIGTRLTGDAVVSLAGTECDNKSVDCLNAIAHLPADQQFNPATWSKILKKSRNRSTSKRTGTNKPVPTTQQVNEKKQDDPSPNANTSAMALLREDYHKIARICGAQNKELYLKIKEVISESHRDDLRTFVDITLTMQHILKELQEIRKLLSNNITAPAAESISGMNAFDPEVTHE